LRAAGQPIPAPLTLRALIDTGASQTAIDLQCVQALGLIRRGSTTLYVASLAGTPQTFDEYEVNLTFPHSQAALTLFTLPVVASSLMLQGFEVLLGRDVLKNCLLIYDGQAGAYTLAF